MKVVGNPAVNFGYRLEVEDGRLALTFEGPWAAATYWETLALSTVNEVHYRTALRSMSGGEREAVYATGRARTESKIEQVRGLPTVTLMPNCAAPINRLVVTLLLSPK